MDKITQNYTEQPKTKQELRSFIEAEMEKNGNQCNLNHIDTSLVTDFSWLFSESLFNGDIPRWDVSGAVDMGFMFERSKFNGDISKWDVSRVAHMDGMFYKSEFNGDISNWNRISMIGDQDIFLGSAMATELGVESPCFEQVKSHCLVKKLEAALQEASAVQGKVSKARL